MGKLISVGGGDRAQVAALTTHLESWLHEREVQLVQFSLPTRGPVGALIRLQAQSRLRLDPVSLALLWTADRLDLLSREGGILAQLEAGTTVLCMHYAWWEICHRERSDTCAARSAGEQIPTAVTLDPAWLERINARCIRPDLSLCVQAEDGEQDEPAAQGRVVSGHTARGGSQSAAALSRVSSPLDCGSARARVYHDLSDSVLEFCQQELSALLWPGEEVV